MQQGSALFSLHVKRKLNSPCRDLTKCWLPQETRERQNKSRWQLITETLNKEFTSQSELKASYKSVSLYWQELMYFIS